MTSPDLSGQVPDFDGTQTGGPVRLSIAQAAAVLGVNERTVRRRADSGKLPDGWRVSQDVGRRTIVVADSRRLKDVTGQAPGASPDAAGQELQALRAQVGGLEASVAALTAERDWLRDHVGQLTRLLPAPADSAAPQQNAVGRRGWWSRIFRGNREDRNG